MSESKQIFALIPVISSEIGAIDKKRKNKSQDYYFRGIDDVLDAANEPMCRHGVFCTTEVSDLVREQRESRGGGSLTYTTLKMKVTFHAPDGSSVSTITFGEGMDSGDKSLNKAMSAAMKYAFFYTFIIPLHEPESEDGPVNVENYRPGSDKSGVSKKPLDSSTVPKSIASSPEPVKMTAPEQAPSKPVSSVKNPRKPPCPVDPDGHIDEKTQEPKTKLNSDGSVTCFACKKTHPATGSSHPNQESTSQTTMSSSGASEPQF